MTSSNQMHAYKTSECRNDRQRKCQYGHPRRKC